MPGAFRPRFFVYLPEGAMPLPGAELPLAPPDERHARLVLRARPGDACEVVVLTGGADGPPEAGSLFTASFLPAGDPGEESVMAVRLEAPAPVSPPALYVILLQALPDLKSVDLIVEKGTEVGVDAFLLFAAEGSPPRSREQAEKKLARWQRVAEEAAKQSKQLAVPRVTLVPSLSDAVSRAESWGSRVLLLEPGSALSLREALADALGSPDRSYPLGAAGPRSLAMVVGPEGGWSGDELDFMARRGLLSASLGRRILRAETAGTVAAAVARFALQDT